MRTTIYNINVSNVARKEANEARNKQHSACPFHTQLRQSRTSIHIATVA